MQYHAVSWAAYCLLWAVGVIVWLVVVVPAGTAAPLPVRIGAPVWWVVTTLLVSHHWNKYIDTVSR